MPRSILVVDDDQHVVDYLVESLQDRGFVAQGTHSATQALASVAEAAYDVVVSDVVMPEMRGLDLLRAIRKVRPSQLVILITAFGSIDLAMETLRAGAVDFVTKPFEIDTLLHAIERALAEREVHHEIVRLRTAGDGPDDEAGVVARSPAMARVLETARRAATTSSAVLITGESGVGKGVVARLIHAEGPRRAGPFIQVNCSALPITLVESELFGVRRGAYTDAKESRAGLFVEAQGGTLFLDEVGELPVEAQPKLLQALETSTIRPVGASSDSRVDVRVIASTNTPLEEALRARRFRPDLYYRLNVIRIEIPPLRDRTEDIPPLVDRFLERHCRSLDRSMVGISADALGWLRAYGWPGNVRELSNVLERAVALTDHDCIVPEDLHQLIHAAENIDLLGEAAVHGRTLAEVELAYIRRVLDSVGGNVQRAAAILGVDRRTVYRKLQEV
jgi:DNA-binding NtrC family response regulator